MRQLTAILLVLIGTGTGTAQQTGSLKKMPVVNEGRPHNIDVKHIDLDLRFDWIKKQVYGTAALTFSLFESADSVFLDAGMLTIHSIISGNGTSLKFEYDGADKNDGLKIMLGRICRANEEATVKISYHSNWVNITDPNNLGGSNGKGIRFFEPTFTEPKKRRQAWSMGEATSNRYWFPAYDDMNDLRTTTFTATVEKNLTVISNGSLQTTDNTDGTHTFRYSMNKPYPNCLTSFVVGEYADIKQQYQGIPFHSFGYPDEAAAVAASVARLPDMARFFSETTGVPYPFTSYAQIFVQELPAFTGNITAATITENMIDDYGTHADYFYLWDLTEAEALAHQWFGGYLYCNDWSEAWLDKSFAHYFNCLYNEYKNGKEEMLLYQFLYDHNVLYLGDWNAGIRHPVVTKNYDDAGTFVSDNYTSVRGALVLRMLRKQLGEDNWWKAVRLYVSRNAGKPVGTGDLRTAVEEACGQPMDWFFDQWIYKMGHPVFEVMKNYDAVEKKLTIRLTQIQKSDTATAYPQVDFFKGNMEIEIDGRIERVWIEPKAENRFSFTCNKAPQLVNIDYESTWIKEMKFEKPLHEWLYQLENDNDILGRSQALNELVAVVKNEKTAEADKVKIFAAFRKAVMSKSYWRFRLNVLTQLRSLLAPFGQTEPVKLDEQTTAMLLSVIKNEKSWNRTSAISFLGMTRDQKYASIYINALKDTSDRVVNAAAIALGKTRSPKAFEVLVKLKDKPSWKNQSLISALNGLKELGDKRGVAVALAALSDRYSAHWTLATPVWDYRLAAASTIAALGNADTAFPMILQRFRQSMVENDVNDIFSNVLLITTLADPRGKEVFDQLKIKFKDDAITMAAVDQYESQFRDKIKGL